MKKLTYLSGLALIILSFAILPLWGCNKAPTVPSTVNPRSSVFLVTNGDTISFSSRINLLIYTYQGGTLNTVTFSFADSLSQNIFSWVGNADTSFNSPQSGTLQTIAGGNQWILQGVSFSVTSLNLTYSFASDSANTMSGNFSGQIIGTNSAGQVVRYNVGNGSFSAVPVERAFF
jgi:hypothetical protein